MLLGQEERVYQVIHAENVPNLSPVTVQGDRPAFERANKEVGNPTLVLGPELVRAVNAAHPEHDRRYAEGPCVVEHILIGRTFGAAVGAVEVERPGLTHPGLAEPGIHWFVPQVATPQLDVLQRAVHLVGRSKNERRRGRLRPDGLEEVEGAP